MEEIAIFAGGCFWCMEAAFQLLDGVDEVISGYTGGNVKKPSYEQVCSGKTGHVEAVLVRYNSKKIPYERLLDVYWQSIDPTDDSGQFADKGSQYNAVIFYSNDKQKKIALKSKKKLEDSEKFEKPITTKILKAKTFYEAEEYHQDYFIKNSVKYKLYEMGSGRKKWLKKIWGK